MAKKIHREFTVDVMELIFGFAVIVFQIFAVYFCEIMEIVRALRVHAFVPAEEFPVFLWN